MMNPRRRGQATDDTSMLVIGFISTVFLGAYTLGKQLRWIQVNRERARGREDFQRTVEDYQRAMAEIQADREFPADMLQQAMEVATEQEAFNRVQEVAESISVIARHAMQRDVAWGLVTRGATVRSAAVILRVSRWLSPLPVSPGVLPTRAVPTAGSPALKDGTAHSVGVQKVRPSEKS